MSGCSNCRCAWYIRNALIVSDTDAPSVLAATMLEGSYPGFVYQENRSTFPYGGRADPIFGETEKSVALALKEVTRKIVESPLVMIKWHLFEKPVYLFQWDNIDGVGDIFIYPIRSTPFRNDAFFQAIHGAFYYTHFAVLTLAIIGALAAWIPSATKRISPEKRPTPRLASFLLAFLYLAGQGSSSSPHRPWLRDHGERVGVMARCHHVARRHRCNRRRGRVIPRMPRL
jgi:hypothetical protein